MSAGDEIDFDFPLDDVACEPHGRIICENCGGEDGFAERYLQEVTRRAGIRLMHEELMQLSPIRRVAAENRLAELGISKWSLIRMRTRRRVSREGELPPPTRILEQLKGTGRVFPVRFQPPSVNATPDALFPAAMPQLVWAQDDPRFVKFDDPATILLYTDGSCRGNGGVDPHAGCGFVYGPSDDVFSETSCRPTRFKRAVGLRLEDEGTPTPGGTPQQNSCRAESRAVLGALRFRSWYGEGFRRVVIATDSQYVVDGATQWTKRWMRNGWLTRTGEPAKNKDLWERLLGDVELKDDFGVDVQFWKIPRRLNKAADKAAKEAAMFQAVHGYHTTYGLRAGPGGSMIFAVAPTGEANPA